MMQASLFTRHAFVLLLLGMPAYIGAAENLRLSWTNNLLAVSDPRLPGGNLEVWYLEAFCRSRAWGRDWRKTTLPHKTTLTWADPRGRRLKFRTLVEPDIEVRHEIRSRNDELELSFELTNHGK